MNALINHMAALTGMGHSGIEFSLADLTRLMPTTISPWIIAAMALFLVVAIDDTYFNQQPNETASPKE